ncbi:MAG: hypothetical protein IIX31_00310 [Alistipes sp.]|jgi:hypothetical protein|nr:hypothetical protein [Alistipes sp.]
MKRYSFLITLIIAAIMTGCAKKYYPSATSSYYMSETTFLNDIGDGSITVRASGLGKTVANARLQARKQAVRDIIFKGVNVPNNSMLSKPIVTEVNAAQKYQSFFNVFFADNGDWKKFVSNQDNKPTKHVYKETTLQVKEYMTVRVDVFALKNYLIENGIVKP